MEGGLTGNITALFFTFLSERKTSCIHVIMSFSIWDPDRHECIEKPCKSQIERPGCIEAELQKGQVTDGPRQDGGE